MFGAYDRGWDECEAKLKATLYTGEEIKELVQSYLFDLGSTYKDIPFDKWFEQNKKK